MASVVNIVNSSGKLRRIKISSFKSIRLSSGGKKKEKTEISRTFLRSYRVQDIFISPFAVNSSLDIDHPQIVEEADVTEFPLFVFLFFSVFEARGGIMVF